MEMDTDGKTIDELYAEARALRRSGAMKLAGGAVLCAVSVACFTKAFKMMKTDKK